MSVDGLFNTKRQNQTALGLRSGKMLSVEAFTTLRRKMVLEFCKWDPQVGDVSTIAAFPLLLQTEQWSFLAHAAERLAQELVELEKRLLDRHELHAALGMPRGLRRLLSGFKADRFAGLSTRVIRFDFHPTRDGWRVSEANSDVPGGYSEASALPMLMKEHFPTATIAGDPAAAYVRSLSNDGRTIALLSAPGFMEDQQVVANLCRLLQQSGCRPHLVQPQHLVWRDDRPVLETRWYTGSVDAIVRFYQAEWLASLPERIPWKALFDSIVPVVNPGIAVLSESKRLPLVWDRLPVALPAWRQFLPETRDPRDAPWQRDEQWLLKTAFCNNGDTVVVREFTSTHQWFRTCLDVTLHPGAWITQKRFETVLIETPIGRMYPCIGVYVINGHACGIYGRLSANPVVKYDAVDAAVLLEP